MKEHWYTKDSTSGFDAEFQHRERAYCTGPKNLKQIMVPKDGSSERGRSESANLARVGSMQNGVQLLQASGTVDIRKKIDINPSKPLSNIGQSGVDSPGNLPMPRAPHGRTGSRHPTRLGTPAEFRTGVRLEGRHRVRKRLFRVCYRGRRAVGCHSRFLLEAPAVRFAGRHKSVWGSC